MNQPMNRLMILRAWCVHWYTSLGLIAGLLALICLIEGRIQLMFAFLGLALVIDGSDGPLARAWNVKRWTPEFDGRKLDDITDYLNYVFIPAFFMYHTGIVSGIWSFVLVLALLASGFGFCRSSAKTEDNYFTGFPSYWNIVAFYLYVMAAPVFINGLVILILALMVFTPLRFITGQTKALRVLTTGLQLLWLLNLGLIVINLERLDPRLVYLSLAYPIYHFTLSLFLNIRSSIRSLEGSQEAGAS